MGQYSQQHKRHTQVPPGPPQKASQGDMGVPRQTTQSTATSNNAAIKHSHFHCRFIEQTLREARGTHVGMMTGDEHDMAPTSEGAAAYSVTKATRSSMRLATPCKTALVVSAAVPVESVNMVSTATPQTNTPMTTEVQRVPVAAATTGCTPRTPAARKMHVDEHPLPEGEVMHTNVPGPLHSQRVEVPEGPGDVDTHHESQSGPGDMNEPPHKGLSTPIVISDDEATPNEADSVQDALQDSRKDEGAIGHEKYHRITNRGHGATVYTMVGVYPLEEPPEAEIIVVPSLERQAPLYSSAYFSDGVKRQAGMIFPVANTDRSPVMVLYETLEEFNKLRGLATHQLVLQTEQVKIEGDFECGSGAMPYGHVDYQQAPFITSTGKVEKMRILHLVLRMSRPEDSVQCCLNMSLLSFNDLSMHMVSTVVSTAPTGADLLRHPNITRSARLVIPALLDYQDWHAQCVQWANSTPTPTAPTQTISPSPLPHTLSVTHSTVGGQERSWANGQSPGAAQKQGAAIVTAATHTITSAEMHAAHNNRPGAQLTPTSPEREPNINRPPNVEQDKYPGVLLTPTSPEHEPIVDGPSVATINRRDPRIGFTRGVYPPMGTNPS